MAPFDAGDSPAVTTLSFADLLAAIEQNQTLTATRRRDLASSVRRFTALLALDPKRERAGVVAHRARVRRFVPAVAGLSPKAWRNILAGARAALRIAGVADSERRQSATPAWRALRNAPTDIAMQRGLARLTAYCSARGIEPDAVTDSTIVAFHVHLLDETTVGNPDRLARMTCLSWNRSVQEVPGWPRQRLTVPSFRQTMGLPWRLFPESLQAEFREWQEVVGGKRPFDPRAPVKPLRPATLHAKAEQLRRFASAVVRAGVPIAALTGLGVLLEPRHAEAGLAWFLKRDGKPTPSVFEMTATLVQIAQHWLQMDPGDLALLQRAKQRLRCRRKGLTTKNWARLRPLCEPANVDRLLALPSKLVAIARRIDNPRHAALTVQTAVAIEILLNAPIRLRNLAQLDLRRHVVLGEGARTRNVRLCIDGAEVKNGMRLDYELQGDAARLLRDYVRQHLPVLGGASRALFPGTQGGPKHVVTLGGQVSAAIRHHLGLVVNPHLFRHFAAKLYLEAHPGEFAVVSRLLGHRSVQTTLDFYAAFDNEAAARRYHETVLSPRRSRRVGS